MLDQINYGNKPFEVLEGKGYGIIDDCGGIFGLVNIFEKKNTDWGEYNINDFDLKKTNRIIDNYLQVVRKVKNKLRQELQL